MSELLDRSRDVAPVKVPKGFVFPIRPRGPITLAVTTLDGESYTLHIGGVSPLGGSPDLLCPALAFRHLRLILKILFGRTFDAPEIPLRYSDLLDSEGHVQRTMLRRTLTELGNTWMHRVKANKVEALRLLDYNPEIYYRDGVDLESADARENEANICYRLLRKVRFHDDFWRAFLNWSNCWNVRADVVDRLASDVAAACYMLLTPRGYHPEISETNKGRKDAAELLREIGAVVPAGRAELRRTFERSRSDQPSVLQALNGLPTSQGYFLVDERLETNASGTGFNVRFWAIKESQREAQGDPHFQQGVQARGALHDYWISLGLPPKAFDGAQRVEWRTIATYQVDRITELGYPVQKNRRYLDLVHSFIGPARFDAVIGSAHMAMHDTNRPIREGIERWFGGALRNAFREFANKQREAPKRTVH